MLDSLDKRVKKFPQEIDFDELRDIMKYLRDEYKYKVNLRYTYDENWDHKSFLGSGYEKDIIKIGGEIRSGPTGIIYSLDTIWRKNGPKFKKMRCSTNSRISDMDSSQMGLWTNVKEGVDEYFETKDK